MSDRNFFRSLARHLPYRGDLENFAFSNFFTCSRSEICLLIALICSQSNTYAQNSVDGAKEWENVQSNTDTRDFPREANTPLQVQQQAEAGRIQTGSSTYVRRFHEVLDQLLAEFGYDVKMGQLSGLKNLAIRRVDVSDAIPSTYQQYLELLTAERIRDNSKVRLISCIACKSKTSRFVGGKVIITSPETNAEQMKVTANQLGIDHFMDIVLVYHSTHMVLAFQIFNVETQEMVWTRTYNSETIKSRYQKLAIDYSQVEVSRPGEDYKPDYRFIVNVGGAIVPNLNQSDLDSSFAVFTVRGTEKFDNRKYEFGLNTSLFLTKQTFTGRPSTTEEELDADGNKLPSPFKLAIGVTALYGYNFIGALESYNELRNQLNLGVGFLMASTYLAPQVRLGWDVFFGKRFTSNFGVAYVLPSKVLVDGKFKETQGGVLGELAVGVQF